jgi:hypothetical protein
MESNDKRKKKTYAKLSPVALAWLAKNGFPSRVEVLVYIRSKGKSVSGEKEWRELINGEPVGMELAMGMVDFITDKNQRRGFPYAKEESIIAVTTEFDVEVVVLGYRP